YEGAGYLNVYGENCPTSMIFVNGDSLGNFYTFSFNDFHGLNQVSFPSGTKLEYITVENCDIVSANMFIGVQLIDLDFISCNYLKKLVTPDYTEWLTVENCENLESITLSENLNSLNIEDAPHLANFDIPANLEFCWLAGVGVTDITVPATCKDFNIIHSHELKNATIQSGRTRLDPEMFTSCSGLESVSIPDGITEIGQSAFGFTNKLKEVELPDSVKNIGWGAFIGSGIESINIPSGVTKLEYATFRSCENLGYVVLPDTITRIDEAAFDNCESLTDVYFGGSSTQWYNIQIYNGWAGKASKKSIEDVFGNATIHFANFITGQPSDFVGPVGAQARFSVQTEGNSEDYTYQWQVLKGLTWSNITKNGKSAEYVSTINDSSDGKKFRCIVTNAAGLSITSNEAVIHIGETLEITSQPVDFYGAIGTNATFTVGAKGDDLTYQWQYFNQTWKKSTSEGSKTNSLSVEITSARNGRMYRCIVTDKFGQTIETNTVTINVATTLEITTEPSDFTGLEGKKATFTIEAKGDGLKYQWQYKNTSGVWKNSNSTGYDTPQMKIKITSARDGQQYRCVVTDINQNKEISEPATIHMASQLLKITTQPRDCYQDVLGAYAKFSVVAEGDELSYQWQYKTAGGSWKNSGASGSTTNKMTIKVTEARNNQQYRCVITDKYGNEVTSDPAKIIIDTPRPTQINSQPSDFIGNVGDTAVFTVEAVGISELTYQWQYNNGSGWKKSSSDGYNTSTLSIKVTEARNGQKYRCIVTDTYGNSVTSGEAIITVSQNLPKITSQPVSYVGAIGTKATFTVAAEGEDLTYQWQYKSASSSTWSNS
ncbi:MAG: leucine-rich repeat protein, partial [Erysipelotrichaceae bacterium]|nr:leucine-rich repeat protein [Erysipelotrichaceae bacterium]